MESDDDSATDREDSLTRVFKKFMLAILSLPHSNAECEKVFSRVNDIKTKKPE